MTAVTRITRIGETLLLPGSHGALGRAADNSTNGIVYGKRAPDDWTPLVFGDDNRSPISAARSKKFPWRLICSLEIRSNTSDKTFRGTGWLAGPKLAVTAGHCVFSQRYLGGLAGTIRVVPGRSGAKGKAAEPFGAYSATRFGCPDEWRDHENPEHDIGWIFLDEAVGDSLGRFALAALPEDELKHYQLNIAGYPVDLGDGNHLYHHANLAGDVDEALITYQVDTKLGQSGSPIWIQEDKDAEPRVVGVHSGSTLRPDGAVNKGIRINEEVLKMVDDLDNAGQARANAPETATQQSFPDDNRIRSMIPTRLRTPQHTIVSIAFICFIGLCVLSAIGISFSTEYAVRNGVLTIDNKTIAAAEYIPLWQWIVGALIVSFITIYVIFIAALYSIDPGSAEWTNLKIRGPLAVAFVVPAIVGVAMYFWSISRDYHDEVLQIVDAVRYRNVLLNTMQKSPGLIPDQLHVLLVCTGKKQSVMSDGVQIKTDKLAPYTSTNGILVKYQYPLNVAVENVNDNVQSAHVNLDYNIDDDKWKLILSVNPEYLAQMCGYKPKECKGVCWGQKGE